MDVLSVLDPGGWADLLRTQTLQAGRNLTVSTHKGKKLEKRCTGTADNQKAEEMTAQRLGDQVALER